MKCQLNTPPVCRAVACLPAVSAYRLPALPRQRCSLGAANCRPSQQSCLYAGQQCRRKQHSTVCTAAAAFGSVSAAQATAATASTVPTATAAAHTAASLRPLPFAALSRVLLTANNSTVFRTALNKRQPVSGPMGLLLFLLTLVAASIAAIRGAFVKKSKSCKTCRGFGVQRCRLCLGSGRVDWAAKLKHFDVCPLCMNKRFIVCAECGGHYHRPMFNHRRRQVGGAFEPEPGADTGAGGFDGPIVLNLAGAGATAATTTAMGGTIMYRSLQSYDGAAPGMGGQLLSNMTD